jgi:D-methionine transport system permease protein
MLHELINALEETLFMVFGSGILTFLLGLPLGILMAITKPKQVMPNRILHKGLSAIVNLTKSVPYLVFMIALIPLTRIILGTAEGCLAAILSLTLAATPFFAHLCQQAISNVTEGLIETAEAMGASPTQIIRKILIPEALPDIKQSITVTLVHLVGYSAIAGALVGVGLGNLVMHKGYYAFQTDYIIATVILLIVLIQLIQLTGQYISKRAV